MAGLLELRLNFNEINNVILFFFSLWTTQSKAVIEIIIVVCMICVFYPFEIQLINENPTDEFFFCGTLFRVGELKDTDVVVSLSCVAAIYNSDLRGK